MIKLAQASSRGNQLAVAFMKTKSLMNYTNSLRNLIGMALGLSVTLIILASPFSGGVTGRLMEFDETIAASGTYETFLLLSYIVDVKVCPLFYLELLIVEKGHN